ncbi:copper amine oxidase [Paenibacillus timonensis]|uniref:copper amine oxidase n=1 Tax=Paenibacillus timonensis TaxID=225915 RepID=UPI003F956079
MKKWSYLLSGILIGAIIATSGNAAAAQIKSMIGQKVTGELKVVVNGKELSSKGAVINGVTNAPVRALSDALGANLALEGKVITITTSSGPAQSAENETSSSTPNDNADSKNKYFGGSKASLEALKESLENNSIKPAVEEREFILKEIEILKTSGMNGTPAEGLEAKQKQLAEYDAIIEKATKELRLVEEALEALEK